MDNADWRDDETLHELCCSADTDAEEQLDVDTDIPDTIFFSAREHEGKAKIRLRTQDRSMSIDRLVDWEELEQLLKTKKQLRSTV